MSARSHPERNLTRPLEMSLASHHPLGAAEVERLRAGLTDVTAHPNGAEIGRSRGTSDGPRRAVLSGWVAWLVPLSHGRRQIIALGLPGDVLESPPGVGFDILYSALGPVRTADVTLLAQALDRPGAESGALAQAWSGARDAATARWVHQVLRLGRLSAYERAASLLVELHERQRRAGLADDSRMLLPLTQEALSDVLGLSVAHVNRTLQQLRRDSLIAYRAGQLTFTDLEGLRRVAVRGEV